ncbi:MAG: A/G-specific adenine glycosylase [Gammaproteobacteria bacterium]|nr:A/G-specific adenine glycosylase [Gammaproteobacteria bacterium]
MPRAFEFSAALLAWFERHGRHDLPWQHEPTPYRIWVSEIMLQQTQVETVMPYFARFIGHFPTIAALAAAPLDQVLHLWSGLGYYARARNLHRAAHRVIDRHGGVLPDAVETLQTLPGIGRSTAGAIVALAFGRRAVILDGNVKRVLARCHALDDPPTIAAGERRLWQLAEQYTPQQRVAAYTQAIMDLGATVCTRERPACDRCPLAAACVAQRQRRATDYPRRRPARGQPVRTARWLLIVRADGEVLLERRPPTGLWGGLWCLPECALDEDPREFARSRLGIDIDLGDELPRISHRFTHFRLEATPLRCAPSGGARRLMASGDRLWYNVARPAAIGIATPVSQLLKNPAVFHQPVMSVANDPDRGVKTHGPTG